MSPRSGPPPFGTRKREVGTLEKSVAAQAMLKISNCLGGSTSSYLKQRTKTSFDRRKSSGQDSRSQPTE